ncbi:phosphonate ABC transporter ATP-binding protein [Mycoplasma sp. 527]
MKKIQFEHYYAAYPRSRMNILNDINLLINQGEMIAIIGRSGSGKTTLFNAILKQLKTSQGKLFINEYDIENISKRQWKKIVKRVGYLSQETNLIESLNVYENILHFYSKYKNVLFSLLKIITKSQKQEIYNVLDSLGILDKIFTKISDLSGGQKQRVEIAKILLRDVDIILADEPTSSLDIKTSKDIMSILKNINMKYNTTVLVNIHDLNVLRNNFSKYIFINNGQIIKNGDLYNLSEKELEQLYES